MEEREEFQTAEIALSRAKALFNATVGQPDPDKCAQLAAAIGALMEEREEFQTAEIALSRANALSNATVGQPDLDKRAQLAAAIEALMAEREEFQTAEIALERARAWILVAWAQTDAEQVATGLERSAEGLDLILGSEAGLAGLTKFLRLLKANSAPATVVSTVRGWLSGS